jgi:hypothetical protein
MESIQPKSALLGSLATLGVVGLGYLVASQKKSTKNRPPGEDISED